MSDTKKACSVCGKEKKLNQFYKRSNRPNGCTSQCKKCTSEYRASETGRASQKRYAASAKGRATQAVHLRTWKAKNQEHVRDRNRDYMFRHNLKNVYGITEDEYNEMLAAQKEKCAICRKRFTKRPHIDHCHATGKVRGLLCAHCNRGLGGFKDEVKSLQRAIRYLEAQA